LRPGRLLIPIVIGATGCLWAQSPDAYREAYAAWQSASANLEVDAAKAGELLAVKTDAASPAAVKYEQARKAFFQAQGAPLKEAAQRLQPMQMPADSSATKAADDMVATEEPALAKNITVLGNDPDEGIRQLRQALEKERAALLAVRDAAAARKAAAAAAQTAAAAAEHARMGATENTNAIAANFQQSADAEAKMIAAWPAYYRSLAEGARGKSAAATVSSIAPARVARPAAANSSSANTAPPASVPPRSPAPNQPASPRASAPVIANPVIANPVVANAASGAPAAAASVQPPVPLARYTGSWGWTQGVSNYSGEPPTMFDVIVKVDNGQVQGIVSAAFLVGRTREPSVRFTFNGPLQATRNQVFSLKTNDGITGTVELIPGPAFNLLEVKFNLDAAPRKVSTSDVTLLKK